MDHELIDQSNLVDRYLMGKLTAEELSGFEAHLLDCPRCIDRLRTTNNFLQDLRQVNAEPARERAGTRGLKAGLRAAWSRLSAGPIVWAALGVCVVALVGTYFAIRHAQRLQAEVNQARSEVAESERRYEAERQAAALADRQRQETEAALTERLRQLEAKVSGQGEMAAPAGGVEPGVSLPIFVLHTLRGGDPNGSDPAAEIKIPRVTKPLVFSLLLEDEARYPAYRIKIIDPHGQPILEKGGFQPDRNGALSIGFNSSFFRAGNHLLVVEGMKQAGGVAAVGKYPFRIIKNP